VGSYQTTAGQDQAWKVGALARAISLLRRLGFSLEQISSVLDDPDWQSSSSQRWRT
jgi:hypothetical protein